MLHVGSIIDDIYNEETIGVIEETTVSSSNQSQPSVLPSTPASPLPSSLQDYLDDFLAKIILEWI